MGWVKLFIIVVTIFLFITGLPDCPAAADRGDQCNVLPAYEGDPEYDSD